LLPISLAPSSDLRADLHRSAAVVAMVPVDG
jgi:hypothetical protein